MDLSSSLDAEGSSVTNFNYLRAQAGRGKSVAGGGGGGGGRKLSVVSQQRDHDKCRAV